MTSSSGYSPGTLMGPHPVHSKARAVFRFFLYSGSFVLFTALTWGQDSPGDDPKSSLVAHAVLICISLILVIGEAIALHAYNALTTRRTVTDQSLGEEIFGVLLIAVFGGLYYGLKWHLLPAVVYAKHLDGSLTVVFWAIVLIILWSDGIFDRR
jgi:hypothetical protein